MIEAQKAKAVEERARPFGSNFVHFVKSSKPQMINIFFSFVCVLLAYQIHAMRAGIKKLMAENEEKDEEVGRLRGILAELSREPSGDGPATFASAAASRCADIVRGRFSDSEKRAGYSWILGKKLASGDAVEMDNLSERLGPAILSEVRSVVGDTAFTPEELKERRVAELQTQPQGGPAVVKSDAQMDDLISVLDDVHKDESSGVGEDDEGNSTKIRRTRYAI